MNTTAMQRRNWTHRLLLAAAAALMLLPCGLAQFAGQSPRDSFIDTSILKPAPGSNVSILVFEDLGCPACAHAHPYELEAAAKEHVPLVRRDFPLAAHVWTFDAAVFARYLEDKVNPSVAGEYRTDVFLAQRQIGSKDDLQQYDSRWAAQHSLKIPSPLDPGGTLAAKVKADYDLGTRLHVTLTPTIVVVTPTHYQVVTGTASGSNDPAQLDAVVQGALAQVASAPTHSAAGSASRQ